MSLVKLRDIDPRGELKITGSLAVSGSLEAALDSPAVFAPTDPTQPTLVVSGALEIVRAEIQNQIISASLNIQNLGSLSDRASDDTIDLGGFF